MHFRIDRHTEGTLPLISAIPDYGVVQLEGYNGVGKSLTVRLLQICAAEPLALEIQSESWRSFCAGLGRLTVTVTGLRGATELRFDIDGDTLLAASESGGGQTLDWFEAAERDGEPLGSVEELRSLLAVPRIGGDVGLVETLAEIADEQARLIESRLGPAVPEAKLLETEALLSDLGILLGSYSSELVLERQEAAQQATQERDEAQASFAETAAYLERLDQLAAMSARLEEIDVEGTELEARIEELDEEIGGVRGQLRAANEELTAAEKASAQSQELLRQMESAQRSYKNAAGRARNLTGEVAQALDAAGVADAENLGVRRSDLNKELEATRQRRIELDASDAMGRLIDQLQPLVDAAVAAGLADQPLLSDADGLPRLWTVGRLAEAMAARRDELRQVPNPREAAGLDARIASLVAALRGLDRVGPLLEQRAKARAKMDEAQALSKDLDEQLDASAAEKLDQLRDTRRKLDEELSRLSGQRTTAAHRLDALGAPQEREALGASLKAKLAEAGLTADQLEPALAAADRTAETEREALRHISDLHRAAVLEAERDQAELRSIVSALHTEGRYAWVGTLTTKLPKPEQSLTEQLTYLDRLKSALTAADRRFDEVRTLFVSARRGLGAVSASLRGQDPASDWRLTRLRGWLEQQAEGWFSDSAVAEALLGKDVTNISVDLESGQIAWVTSDDEARSKPLESLSSGEQAFAFTQARLALASQQSGSAANRLIALDEFGAFVSTNRMQQLSEFLQHWRRDHATDQILLILPANQDYAALARAATGDRAIRYRRMAKSLDDNEYLVEEFETT
jgi:ABC-type molybdenum transport system ATPase subunit/photorepair protein PhrA